MREFCHTVTTSRRALTLRPVQALEMELELAKVAVSDLVKVAVWDQDVVEISAAVTSTPVAVDPVVAAVEITPKSLRVRK